MLGHDLSTATQRCRSWRAAAARTRPRAPPCWPRTPTWASARTPASTSAASTATSARGAAPALLSTRAAARALPCWKQGGKDTSAACTATSARGAAPRSDQHAGGCTRPALLEAGWNRYTRCSRAPCAGTLHHVPGRCGRARLRDQSAAFRHQTHRRLDLAGLAGASAHGRPRCCLTGALNPPCTLSLPYPNPMDMQRRLPAGACDAGRGLCVPLPGRAAVRAQAPAAPGPEQQPHLRQVRARPCCAPRHGCSPPGNVFAAGEEASAVFATQAHVWHWGLKRRSCLLCARSALLQGSAQAMWYLLTCA
jgi:hypothetical protein